MARGLLDHLHLGNINPPAPQPLDRPGSIRAHGTHMHDLRSRMGGRYRLIGPLATKAGNKPAGRQRFAGAGKTGHIV